jgi:hypothetical protein
VRRANAPIEYLEPGEVETLLKSIDRSTRSGKRDYVLFAAMLNTGARVQEILDLRLCDIRTEPPYQVRLQTAHATRALERGNTTPRRAELARGLAVWAIGIRGAPPGESSGSPMLKRASAETIMDYARIGAGSFIRTPSIPVLRFVTGPMAYMLITKYLNERAHGIASENFNRTHTSLNKTFESLEVLAAIAAIDEEGAADLPPFSHPDLAFDDHPWHRPVGGTDHPGRDRSRYEPLSERRTSLVLGRVLSAQR